jgi:hypothetical protein
MPRSIRLRLCPITSFGNVILSLTSMAWSVHDKDQSDIEKRIDRSAMYCARSWRRSLKPSRTGHGRLQVLGRNSLNG